MRPSTIPIQYLSKRCIFSHVHRARLDRDEVMRNSPFVGIFGIGFFVDESAFEPVFGFAFGIGFTDDLFLPVSAALAGPFHAGNLTDGCVDVIAHAPAPVDIIAQVATEFDDIRFEVAEVCRLIIVVDG